MKILLSGFDPFGAEAINPAYEAIKALPDEIEGARLIKLRLPTAYRRSFDVLQAAIEAHRPDVVLSIGQAGGRLAITPEQVAINLAEARIPDNDGDQPIARPLQPGGETAYFSSLPVKAMAAAIKAEGLAAEVSYSAGTFVCNAIMYQALYLAATRYPEMKAGFIHVPYCLEQVAGRPETPAMSLEDITRGLAAAIRAIVRGDDSLEIVAGSLH